MTVEGVAAWILRSDRKEVALRPDMHQGREVTPTTLRAKPLHQVVARAGEQRLDRPCVVAIGDAIGPDEAP